MGVISEINNLGTLNREMRRPFSGLRIIIFAKRNPQKPVLYF